MRKPASARLIAHADGPDVARARGRPATSTPNGPSSARSVPRRGRAPGFMPLVDTDAMAGTSSRSVPPSIPAPMRADRRSGRYEHLTPKLAIPDGHHRPGAAATIARVEPGGERLAIHAASHWLSNRIFKSYVDMVALAAEPGTTSSTNHARSCPSACANGRMGSDQ